MLRSPYIVLADDLTGAAELTALAHQAGLHAVLLTTPPKGPVKGDVIVIDTGTRLLSPLAAERRMTAISKQLARRPHAGIFKKVDSVLRGNVLVEIEACAKALGLSRSVLVPCNPSLGRIIYNGTYFVSGTPLHRTAFARDPHHPRRSSDVRKLLLNGRATRSEIVCHHPDERLPESGVIVGEAHSPADVALWASHLDKTTLPAGGADFFRCWLVQQRAVRSMPKAAPVLPGATLLLSGTMTPPDPATPLSGPQLFIDAHAVPRAAALAAKVRAQLEACGQASVLMRGRLVRKTGISAVLNKLFSQTACHLRRSRSFEHVIVTGGATAAAVLAALGWDRLEVVRVWGPGVVTLRSVRASRCLVTLKPGSYAWPGNLLQHFEQELAA